MGAKSTCVDSLAARDGGETFGSLRWDPALVEPICLAGVIRLTPTAEHGTAHLLFANPASTRRERLTVRLSADGGHPWPVCRVLSAGPAAYSDLAVAPEGTMPCLCERGSAHPYETLTMARFAPSWLTCDAAA